MLIEKIPYSLCLVTSREFDDKVWDLENMLKKELFAKERCASLVNEKPYNPNKLNENAMPAFLSEQQKLCCVYCQGEHFPTECDRETDVNVRKEILEKSSCKKMYKKLYLSNLQQETPH